VVHETLPFFAALIPALLWILLLCPLLLRSFGLSIPLNWRKRRGMTMNEGQSVLWGVLGWGVGMMICHSIDVYVRWLMYRSPPDRPTIWGFVGTVLYCTLAGTIFGLFTTFPKKKQTVE
jgi:hypothetical protein